MCTTLWERKPFITKEDIMYKHIKIIYTCFCMVILSFCFFVSVEINKVIYNQQQVIDKKTNELNYILNLNKEIETRSYNLQELEIKNKKINDLKEEATALTEKINIIENSVNSYTKLNNDVIGKINYYE